MPYYLTSDEMLFQKLGTFRSRIEIRMTVLALPYFALLYYFNKRWHEMWTGLFKGVTDHHCVVLYVRNAYFVRWSTVSTYLPQNAHGFKPNGAILHAYQCIDYVSFSNLLRPTSFILCPCTFIYPRNSTFCIFYFSWKDISWYLNLIGKLYFEKRKIRMCQMFL